uniref:Solute carrier family 30 member 1b n=1 Tax=Esox lucius TaxID=8010 RepID=A0AAY5KYH6_ESOLU
MAWEQNRLRLLCMLSMTSAFFIVEVAVSRVTASLSMLSDSFHMLSDVITLVVALIAMRFSETTQATNTNTFGWVRAEVMGALVNTVFLAALCFSIIVEAIERFTTPHEIESLQVVVGVGSMGIFVNLLGLLFFHRHAGHGHSGQGHSHGSSIRHQTNLVSDKLESHMFLGELNDNHHESALQLKMQGVFLHVLGDTLGSVIPCQAGEICVNPCYNHNPDHSIHHPQHINTSLVTMFSSSTQTSKHIAGPCWVLYLDPTLSIIMAAILHCIKFPLLKESALILLQTVPKQVNITRLLWKLRNLDGVLAVHDLHIWQLAGSRIIATAHIKCLDPVAYMGMAKKIKSLFHDEGIHATTVQPEFVTIQSESNVYVCELSCRKQCAPKLCCCSFDRSALGRTVGEKFVSFSYYSTEQPSPLIRQLNSAAIKRTATQSAKVDIYTEAESSV